MEQVALAKPPQVGRLELSDLRPDGERLFRFNQLRDLGIHYSKTHLRRLIDAKKFPTPVRLVPGRSAHVAFVERDLWQWWQGRKQAAERATI